MPFPTSYAEQSRAYPGMLADLSASEVESYVQGEASAEMPFGVVVAEGTASTTSGTPDKAIMMVDANSKPAGGVVHSHDYSSDALGNLGTSGVKPTAIVGVLRKGRMYVKCETACTKGDAAFIRHTSGAGGTQKGAVRNSADTATAVLCRGVTFAETKAAVGDGMVLVDIDTNNIGAVAGLT